MPHLFALVDYDNVKSIRREVSRDDVLQNLESILAQILSVRRQQFSDSAEVVMRLYGGWVDKNGAHTSIAQWMLTSIPHVRGRREGARIQPQLALSNLDSSFPSLAATLVSGGQKMVDTLLVADACYIASEYECPLLVYSDDTDVIPGVLHAARSNCRVGLLRSKLGGEAINDRIMQAAGVILL